jgi:CheY-like chemotaxis protein
MALQILIVENDISSLELMVEALGSLDVEIEAHTESAKAMSAIDQRKFDGVFLDLQMPGLDGFALTERVRGSERNHDTPIIITSSDTEADTMQAAFRAGATFYLPKPIDRERLLELMRTAKIALAYHQLRYARMPLRTKVQCKGAVGKASYGETSNLSQGGLLFEANNVFAPGDLAHISFTLPDEAQPIQCLCVVARVDDHGRAGVRFTGLSGSDRYRIRDVVARSGVA